MLVTLCLCEVAKLSTSTLVLDYWSTYTRIEVYTEPQKQFVSIQFCHAKEVKDVFPFLLTLGAVNVIHHDSMKHALRLVALILDNC